MANLEKSRPPERDVLNAVPWIRRVRKVTDTFLERKIGHGEGHRNARKLSRQPAVYSNINISTCCTKMVITDENQLYERWSREFRKSWERLFRHTREQHMFVLFVCSSVYATVIRIYYVILQGRLPTYLDILVPASIFLLLHTRARARDARVLITFNFNDIFLDVSLIARCDRNFPTFISITYPHA